MVNNSVTFVSLRGKLVSLISVWVDVVSDWSDIWVCNLVSESGVVLFIKVMVESDESLFVKIVIELGVVLFIKVIVESDESLFVKIVIELGVVLFIKVIVESDESLFVKVIMESGIFDNCVWFVFLAGKVIWARMVVGMIGRVGNLLIGISVEYCVGNIEYRWVVSMVVSLIGKVKGWDVLSLTFDGVNKSVFCWDFNLLSG